MSAIIAIKVPAVGESVTQVTISRWLVASGDFVERDQPIAELESDKATFEVNAEASGVITIQIPEGTDVAVGAVIAAIDTQATAPATTTQQKQTRQEKEATEPTVQAASVVTAKAQTKQQAATASATSSITSYPRGVASPAAAKLLAESGITVEKINGTGKGGRITKEDVLNALKNNPLTAKTMLSTPPSREIKKEKMSNLRKTISRRLVAAKNETAMLTTFNEVDMSPILTIRNQYKEAFKEKYGISLGFMSFFTRACTIALREFPRVNGIIEDDFIITHDYCDIGIAVSTDRGLVVPVIRNAESLSLAEIELKINELAKKARDGKLTLEEMSGGTFTISNGGVFGSLLSTPILNQPQSAILGMHKVQERPVAINGQIVIRPMMYVALSYDHRIIDGKESVSFLVRVKQLLENPSWLPYGEDPVKYLLAL